MQTANPTQTTSYRSEPFSQTLPGKVILAISASAFVALCAHASIHLPFTPVPITLSDLAVLLVGLMLGPGTAFAALALYLLEGASGLPVFNPGPGGVAQLLGPTGGYLFAYPFAAALAGILRRRFSSSLIAATLASALILVAGVLWLSFYTHSLGSAFYMGAVPFLPGQIVKVVAAIGIVSSFHRLRRA
jgi:biotin transport system substrate-specific component